MNAFVGLAIVLGIAGVGFSAAVILVLRFQRDRLEALDSTLQRTMISVAEYNSCCATLTNRVDELQKDLSEGLDTAQYAVQQLIKRVSNVEARMMEVENCCQRLEDKNG